MIYPTAEHRSLREAIQSALRQGSENVIGIVFLIESFLKFLRNLGVSELLGESNRVP